MGVGVDCLSMEVLGRLVLTLEGGDGGGVGGHEALEGGGVEGSGFTVTVVWSEVMRAGVIWVLSWSSLLCVM